MHHSCTDMTQMADRVWLVTRLVTQITTSARAYMCQGTQSLPDTEDSESVATAARCTQPDKLKAACLAAIV
jgi:hypothetical protein